MERIRRIVPVLMGAVILIGLTTASFAHAGPIPGGPFPPADTFKLHSKAGSDRTIYLDFTGRTVTGTEWNTRYNRPSFTCPPYDIDDDPAFSDQEKLIIQEVWARVAEDFLPFDVDVTTEPPASEAVLIKDGPADSIYGVRVLISPCSAVAPHSDPRFEGWSIYDSFRYYTSQPCFVASDMIGYWVGFGIKDPADPNRLAQGVSHEVGHSLNLAHDLYPQPFGGIDYYYPGNSSGDWGTIMGWPLPMDSGDLDCNYKYMRTTQWDRGELPEDPRYPGKVNAQDDLAVINARLPLRPDDHVGTPGTSATTLLGLGTLTGSGFIGLFPDSSDPGTSLDSDTDVFQFSVFSSGTYRVDVAPAATGPNLDVGLRLAGGSVDVIAEPLDQLSASITADLAPGIYYVTVSGDGNGDPSSDWSHGYTAYGSLGGYDVTVGPQPPPVDRQDIQVSPSVLDFGDVVAGQSTTRPLTISNVGSDPLTISSVVFSPAVYGLGDRHPSLPLTIGPGMSAQVDVFMTPRTEGLVTGDLQITSDDPDEPVVSVAVLGNAHAPVAVVTPTSLGLGSIQVGDTSVRRLTVSNAGSVDLRIYAFNTPTADIRVTAPPVPAVVPPGGSVDVVVEFAPSRARAYLYEINFTTNDPRFPGGLCKVVVAGQGVLRVDSATGAGPISMLTGSGDTLTDPAAVDESTLPTEGKPNLDFPYGLVSFRLAVTTGASAYVTFIYPGPIPSPAQYWKVINGAWTDCTSLLGDDDGDNVLTLRLTDGGSGDADGVPNAEIVDPGGVAWSEAPVVSTPAFSAWSIALLVMLGAGAACWQWRFVYRRH